MSELAQHTERPISQWVTFSLGGEKYGIDVMRVQEVLRIAEIAPVPGAPHSVLGIINLRGNVVTVVDTRTRFGLAPKETDDAARIVIVEVHDVVVGLLVDKVAEVVDIEIEHIEPSPTAATEQRSKCINGVFGGDDGLLILVDLDQLITEQEVSAEAAVA